MQWLPRQQSSRSNKKRGSRLAMVVCEIIHCHANSLIGRLTIAERVVKVLQSPRHFPYSYLEKTSRSAVSNSLKIVSRLFSDLT